MGKLAALLMMPRKDSGAGPEPDDGESDAEEMDEEARSGSIGDATAAIVESLGLEADKVDTKALGEAIESIVKLVMSREEKG